MPLSTVLLAAVAVVCVGVVVGVAGFDMLGADDAANASGELAPIAAADAAWWGAGGPRRDAAPVVSCGEDGQPECPLQRWMDQRLNAPLALEAADSLAEAFDYLASIAPDGYTYWSGWANTGAEAVARGDFEGAKRACQGCHTDHRARYRRELRARPLP